MFHRLLPILPLLMLVLAGCDSSDDNDAQTPAAPEPAPARGTLIEKSPARLTSASAPELLALLTADSTGQEILQLIAAPKCGIDVHQLKYYTVDPLGASTTASGALMIPTGTDTACQGPRPILLYAHGTVAERAFNIADLTDGENAEGILLAAAFASQGYLVVAPNYAGYDSSSLSYHPYLHADQQSKDIVDALTAARSALPTSTAPLVTDSGKLFITGYSEGGYVAMAAHRLLQQTGASVTASAPMSGPYALAAFGDAVYYGRVVRSAPLFAAFITTSYQRAYGDIYASPAAAFESPYANGIETLLPTGGLQSEIFSQGKLPRDHLFSSTPPDAAYAQYTPATEPAALAPVFALGFGTGNLITNAYRLAYLQDAQAQPDGGFPLVTDGRPASAPATGLRKAFKANDLRTWIPTSPVLLCAGARDPTVLYMNTQLIQSYWSANGATAPITVLDVDDSPSPGDPYVQIKAGFAAAKAAVAAAAIASGATDNGAAAVAEEYHGALVPTFCFAAVRSYFDAK